MVFIILRGNPPTERAQILGRRLSVICTIQIVFGILAILMSSTGPSSQSFNSLWWAGVWTVMVASFGLIGSRNFIASHVCCYFVFAFLCFVQDVVILTCELYTGPLILWTCKTLFMLVAMTTAWHLKTEIVANPPTLHQVLLADEHAPMPEHQDVESQNAPQYAPVYATPVPDKNTSIA